MNTGLAFDNGANALYMGSRNPGKLWRSLNANTPTPEDVQWQLVHDFGANKSVAPLAVGWGPQGAALYVNLTDTGDWSTQLLRSDDGGNTWQDAHLAARPTTAAQQPVPTDRQRLSGHPPDRRLSHARSLRYQLRRPAPADRLRRLGAGQQRRAAAQVRVQPRQLQPDLVRADTALPGRRAG